MHLEIQVALNFVISYLYNKLPRRRVNIFAEELEKALKAKFDGHWYPEKPCRGSAFRCLKTSNPVDPVLCIAARESGMDLTDIREHLPQDMSVWIDPGEVSYRIGEKGQIKLLMSEKRGGGLVGVGSGMGGVPQQGGMSLPLGGVGVGVGDELDMEHREVYSKVSSAFNPEAQAFKPATGGVGVGVDSLAASMSSMRVASPTGVGVGVGVGVGMGGVVVPPPKQTVTFTTAAFAQTKFGSTKLKNSSKRPNRMSPTEFSHYIKQRALLQQQQRQKFGVPPVTPQMQRPTPGGGAFTPVNGGVSLVNGVGVGVGVSSNGYPRPRSISPVGYSDSSPPGSSSSSTTSSSSHCGGGGGYLPSYLSELNKTSPVAAGISPFPDTTGLWQPPSASDLLGGLQQQQHMGNGSVTPPPLIPLPPPQQQHYMMNMGGMNMNLNLDGNQQQNQGIDLMDGLNLGSYGNNYQHLLVAN